MKIIKYLSLILAVTLIVITSYSIHYTKLYDIADEALQTVSDLLPMKGIYSGINIKLMKCGGMDAAYKMITMARQMDMKILIGCMTETSCAVTAAAQLSPLSYNFV